MTDKELIKQEIERLKHNTPNAYDLSRFMLLEEIESFINSLPEKFGCEVNFTTKNEDLEEEIQRAYYDKSLYDADNIDRTDFNCIARHFAEWQKQKDLEDLFKSDMTMPNKFYEKGKADAMKEMKETLQTEYEKGRFDMREEMMKNAVDAIIFSELKGSDGSVFQAKSDRFKMDGAKISDKIKVIPIKTEQQ